MRASDLGVHRSLEPPGVLPQAARRLDPSLPLRENEILVDVERLNVDAASFVEFEKLARARNVGVEEVILETVRELGKLQNPGMKGDGIGDRIEKIEILDSPDALFDAQAAKLKEWNAILDKG